MERQLPEWMAKTKVKQTSEQKSASVVQPQTETAANVGERRVAYLMSPRELQLMAKKILGTNNSK